MQRQSACWWRCGTQVEPVMIFSVEEQILLCRAWWRWNLKRSLTDLQSAELQDDPDCHRRSQSHTGAEPRKKKKPHWETKYRKQSGFNTHPLQESGTQRRLSPVQVQHQHLQVSFSSVSSCRLSETPGGFHPDQSHVVVHWATLRVKPGRR